MCNSFLLFKNQTLKIKNFKYLLHTLAFPLNAKMKHKRLKNL